MLAKRPCQNNRCINLVKMQERAEAAEREVEALRRGEFICAKCGLRKDAETIEADF
jgi:hypothetical protein